MFLKIIQKLRFLTKNMFFRKILKTFDGGKFVVQCDWNSQIS